MQNNYSSNIQQVDENTYIVTHQQYNTGNVQTLHPISEVQELKMIIRQMEDERNQVIQTEVLKALKSQEEQFNQFYKENIQKVEEHFLNEVIPAKIRQVENEFYKHQPSSTISYVTSSSATLVPTDIQTIPGNFNQEAYLHQKYQQWKLTYLPVILELKEKQWLERYEAFELKNILQKKYQEWQNVRLLSIIKQKKNQWILDELFSERIIQWNKKQQEILQLRIHQVQQYWDQVIFPQRINAELEKWKTSHQQLLTLRIRQVEEYWQKTVLPQRAKQWQISNKNSVSLQKSTSLYSAEDLDRILAEEHRKWQLESENIFQLRLKAYQQDFDAKILPQMRQQWQKQYSIVHHSSSTVDVSRIDQIINAKYQEWKHTYLPEYLRLEKIKWLDNYTKNQLELIIKKKQEQWESLRLLAIVRQPRNYWVIEAIMKEKMLEWQNTIILQQRKRWEAILLEKDKQCKLNWQKQKKLWESTYIVEKKHQWQKQYILQHPQQKQIIIQQVVKQANIEDQIKKYELLWMQNQEETIKKKIQQVEKYWQGVILQERSNFEKNIQSALQLRTSQIETYWQSVMLPQLKSEWETSHVYQLKTTNEQNTQNIDKLVNQKVLAMLELKIEEWRKNELPIILERSKNEWSINFRNSQEYTMLLLSREQEWLREREAEFSTRLNLLISEQKKTLQSQIQRIQSDAATSIAQLESTLRQKEQQNREIQTRFLTLQKEFVQLQKEKAQLVTSKQSFNSKEAIYQIENQHLKQINQLKLQYEQKLSIINHDKSLLLIQIKQLELNLQHLQKPTRPKQSPSITTIQTNFEKQLQSLQATIKTKESENSFLKKSIDSLTLENQQLNSRLIHLNLKISTVEASLEQSKNHSLKLQYEIKYLKEKETSFNKKLQAKDSEFSQIKSRLESQKALLEKKIRQQSTVSQTVSSYQLKLTELQSQLSIRISTTKNLENELQKKKRQLQQEKHRSASLIHEIQIYKSTIKQHESIIQDLRLEIRKSCDEINRQKLVIESIEQKEKSYIEQIKRLQIKTRDRSQLEEIIRENQRLKHQISRLRERLTFIESNQSRQVYKLKQTVQWLESKLQMSNSHLREGDIIEIQTLRRINYQISDLVSSNKQLQMRIIVLQNQKELSSFGISIERFFVAFQQQMDNFINYSINSKILSPQSIKLYNKFQQKAKQALSHGYVQDYFRQWQSFMRQLIQNNTHLQNINFKNTSHKQYSQSEDVTDIIDKYDAVLNDAKFTLAQFLRTGDEEYLNLMRRSLGLQLQDSHSLPIDGRNTVAEPKRIQ